MTAAGGWCSVESGEWPVYDEEALRRCAELLAAGRSFDYYRGPELTALEDSFAVRCERQHALAFNSGTSALLAAYVGLGISVGDEVLVPTYTFLSTASPLLLLGAVPVLCDSGDRWGNVTVETLTARVTPRTRAIAVTHLWGQPCDMAAIGAFARERGLAVVADCSHAHGSTYREHDVGHYGDVAVFSLGSHKVVSGGLGGILLCDDELIRDTACLLGHFKQRARSDVRDPERARFADVGLGANLRMSPIAAVLAKSHLDALEQILAVKEANVTAALDALRSLPGVAAPEPVAGSSRRGWYGCMVSVAAGRAARDGLLARLIDAGAPVSLPPTAPLHLTSLFSGERPVEPRLARRLSLPPEQVWQRGDLPRSEELFDAWIALPATRLHGRAEAIVEALARGARSVAVAVGAA